MKDSIPDSKNLFTALAINNLKAIGLHTAIVPIALFMGFMVSFDDQSGLFIATVILPIVLILYVLSGHLLKSLPKYIFFQ